MSNTKILIVAPAWVGDLVMSLTLLNALREIYKDFGFNELKVKFSDRPEVRAGDDKVWDKAEKALLVAIDAAKINYSLNPGEGAFYGP